MELEELFEPRHAGEYELKQDLRSHGYKVQDVSDNPAYWDKDIDLIATNLETGITSSIEVKWDSYIANTNNMFIEIENPRSKGGKGWLEFCEADLLAYGDAVNKVFYFFRIPALKQFIEENKSKLETRITKDGSYGYLVSLSLVQHIITCFAIV